MTNHTRAILAAATLAIAAPAAPAADSTNAANRADGAGVAALVIHADLAASVVHLLAIDGQTMILADDSGRRVREPLDGVVALLPAASRPDPDHGVGAVTWAGARGHLPIERLRERLLAGRAGWIELTTGERFPGSLIDSAGAAEQVRWDHPAFGAVDIDVERISAALLQPGGHAAWTLVLADEPVTDVLYLANGDLLTGFLLGVGSNVEFETDNAALQFPPIQVEAIRLANPTEPFQGLVVWLDDGTVTAIDQLDAPATGAIRLTLDAGQSATYALDQLRAIGFDMGRLVPLSSLEPKDQSPIGGRRLADPIAVKRHPDDLLTGSAALGAEDIELPGPMRLRYDLPRDAARFAATARLANDTAPWGDCEVVVRIDGQERFRQRLTQQDRAAPINIPADGRQLEITIHPGAYGPINDRVTLHRPLILLTTPQ